MAMFEERVDFLLSFFEKFVEAAELDAVAV